MAQWIWGYTGETHATAVEDAEELLSHAATVFAAETDPRVRRKKARSIQGLARRVLRARTRFLKARLSERKDPREEVRSARAKELASLRQRLEDTEQRGVVGILEEFNVATALAADS